MGIWGQVDKNNNLGMIDYKVTYYTIVQKLRVNRNHIVHHKYSI